MAKLTTHNPEQENWTLPHFRLMRTMLEDDNERDAKAKEALLGAIEQTIALVESYPPLEPDKFWARKEERLTLALGRTEPV